MEAVGARLAGDGHQGRMIQIGVGYRGEQIGCARPQGRQADACAAGQAAVDIGHKGRPLFMTGGDEAYRRTMQGIHHIQVLLARNPEDVFYPFVFEALDEELGAFHGGWYDRRLQVCGRDSLAIRKSMTWIRFSKPLDIPGSVRYLPLITTEGVPMVW